ncbi:branched-chain amino acid ABC transporter permease [Acuticoccus mangrovi]|uniref:Branched-chain amino acid ABC transporter permease n=1 Tax=Acuticoccus mangrovi TaxID=2796142 RepID=A0A934IKV5_9HYPH|nr:branched-chain amino acid ABC transporter permease [Acuticoccus mangrovi]MBJ3778504.1 branched-chain amino acid ABC transporter permease [Acuticoccus mangrovi]
MSQTAATEAPPAGALPAHDDVRDDAREGTGGTDAAPAARPVRKPRLFARNAVSFVVLWALMIAVPFVAPNFYVVSLVNLFLIYVILIASLNLVIGFCGQISLGHAGFFGLGAYASGILSAKFGLTPWLGLPAAALAGGLGAFVIGLPALRLHGHYLAMATLGFNAILVVLFNELIPLTGGPNGLLGIEPFALGPIALDTDETVFWLVWIVSLVVMIAIANLVDSRMGRSLRAIGGSERGAASLGIDTYRTKLATFAIAGAMAGIAGSLYAHVNLYVSPETFSVFPSIMLLVMVALGGTGRLWGPIFGAAVFIAVPQVLLDFADLELLLFGLAMLIVLIGFPAGIAGLADGWRRWLK